MLKHCRPDILARGHLSLLHRYLSKQKAYRTWRVCLFCIATIVWNRNVLDKYIPRCWHLDLIRNLYGPKLTTHIIPPQVHRIMRFAESWQNGYHVLYWQKKYTIIFCFQFICGSTGIQYAWILSHLDDLSVILHRVHLFITLEIPNQTHLILKWYCSRK